ncbi:Isoflavone 2'-hydroxylase [Cytospora mali]|uniref:Isoflavone 2'-hydroxylase n=1 Tax=Cytospora mali TaxID=578113 RepID=A0A194W9G4_CYTMA|nr:Isoflavone 2'-hydroxylase [Valsa mali]
MALIYYALAFIFTFILLAQILRKDRTGSQNAPFPKGPKPLPYLGNLHQLPLNKSFLAFTEWSRSPETSTSDGVVGLRLGPKARAVILNKWTHVRDLFDSRGKGAIYSDRPYFFIADYVIPKPPGTDLHLVLARHGAKWRRARKTIAEYLSDKEVDKLVSVQDAESSQLMLEFLNSCGGDEGRGGLTAYHRYVLRYFGAVILASVFGLRGKDSDPQSRVMRFFAIQEEWAGILDQGQVPPVDIFPWLRYVPDFLTPWKGWKKRLEFLKEKQSHFYHELLSETQARVTAGKSADCFLSKLISDQEEAVQSGQAKDVYSQLELDYIGGFLLEGGADTTAAAFGTFLLAMAAYPEIQKLAQEEVDKVFGPDNMPHVAEGKTLPFLKACFLEALRWRPPFPTAFPHANTADDTYQGYSIPKGTTIIANAWAISHDPDEFEDPDTFHPQRYLDSPYGIKYKPEKDNMVEDGDGDGEALGTKAADSSEGPISGRRQTYAFGAGRRVCAGQRMAENSTMMLMAKTMWCFDVVYGGDEELDVNVRTAWRDSIITAPKLFPVKFVLRDERKRGIVEREWEQADQFLGRYE